MKEANPEHFTPEANLKCTSYSMKKPNEMANSFFSHDIFSCISTSLPLDNSGIYPQPQSINERVYHIKLKSSQSLSISTFVKYSSLLGKITIKGILLYAYDLLLKKTTLISLEFPSVIISSKQFNMAKLFSFSIVTISQFTSVAFVILFNLVFIISIKEKDKELVHEVLYKEKIKGNRLLLLGYQLLLSEIIFYILSKPDDIVFTFKCLFGRLFDLITISKYEHEIKNSPNKLERFTQSSCKWSLFSGKTDQKCIMLNKETYQVYELKCDNCFFSVGSFYLFSIKDEVYVLQDQVTDKGMSIHQLKLELDSEKKAFEVLPVRVYEIQCAGYEKHQFSIINEECFFVNFYSHFIVYYLNRNSKTFDYVHLLNVRRTCFLAQMFNLNSFSIEDIVYVVLETFKERKMTFFVFKLKKKDVCSSLPQLAASETQTKNDKQLRGDEKAFIREKKHRKRQPRSLLLNETEEEDLILGKEPEIVRPRIVLRGKGEDCQGSIPSFVISEGNRLKSNINVIEGSYLEDLMNNPTDRNETEREGKTEKILFEEKPLNVGEEEKMNKKEREYYFSQIISRSQLKLKQLEERTKALDEKNSKHMNDLSKILNHVLSQEYQNKKKDILKNNQKFLHSKRPQQPFQINQSITESFYSTSSIENSSNSSSHRYQIKPNEKTAIPPLGSSQQNNPSFPQCYSSPFQLKETYQMLYSSLMNYLNSPILSNWLDVLNMTINTNQQQQISAMSKDPHQQPVYPNDNSSATEQHKGTAIINSNLKKQMIITRATEFSLMRSLL